MKLSLLLAEIEYKSELDFGDPEIIGITDDSRKAAPGYIFVCIKGRSFDGHSAAKAASEKGVAAIVATHDVGVKQQIIADDTRKVYSQLCSAFFGYPSRELKIVGVTGTNGKTTTCFVLHDMLTQLGVKCGMIGTVHNVIGDETFPSTLTTPDAFELHGLFRKMVNASCEYCVMEVSSQALEQQRVFGIRFCAAIFTNLTRDHLDYHGSFENYAAAKHILFENADIAIINDDDEAAPLMVKDIDCPVKTFSIKKDSSDYTAKNVQIKSNSTEYELVAEGIIGRVRFAIPGKFSVYNSMGAIVCLAEIGFPFSNAVAAAALAKGVPGRIEVVPTDTDFTVIIDYAHTPDGLVNILETVHEIAQGRVITVFGCGGDRDKTKRPIMGKIAAEKSDIVIVTSDNPRTEEPEAIIDDIFEGIDKPKVPIFRIADRTQAIEKALHKAKQGDIVVLAGKGHETYQILGTEKIHFDEREKVAEILS